MNGPPVTDEPDCGADAPGVMRGLIAGGAVGLLAGGTAAAAIKRPVARGAGALVAAGALVPLGLGLAMRGYVAGGKLKVRDWMLDRHDWRGDETVLDIGAGRGLLAIGAVRRLATGRAIALDCWREKDLSGNGPDALAANAERCGVADRVEIRTADAAELPLPDESVDVALSLLCLHNVEPAPRRTLACREIARVLKPGGRALIGDFTGTGAYVAALRGAGLVVGDPISLVRLARSLMWVVDAHKPL